MSYKSIVALAFGHAGDAATLGFAAALAVLNKARVVVFPVVPDPMVDLVSYGMLLGTTLPDETTSAILPSQKAARATLETECRRICNAADLIFGDGEGLPRMALATPTGRAEIALSHCLALADLVVISQESLTTSLIAEETFAQTLLQRRVPILIARGDPPGLEGPVMIAWDGSAEAGRAVRQALPLIAMSSATTAVQCAKGLDPVAANPSFGPLLDYLRAHAVGSASTETVRGGPEGLALVEAAKRLKAGVLIAGGYGHSRLREAVFGGATRALLDDVEGPSLLMAH
ncbi:universal stress protein [Brevundimonas sp. SL161]|uniref:universal stress protein n=1 Tax=Brevundimonas sp. SL161 TaxID=2804613 RepID=UPI003CE7A9FC